MILERLFHEFHYKSPPVKKDEELTYYSTRLPCFKVVNKNKAIHLVANVGYEILWCQVDVWLHKFVKMCLKNLLFAAYSD